MKILCLCNHGSVRSVCLAQQFKNKGHEAISVGLAPESIFDKDAWKGFSDESIEYFANWADVIIDMSDIYNGAVSPRLEKFEDKVHKLFVGKDIWGNSQHPQLIEICWAYVKEFNKQLKVKSGDR